ncbi:YibE/F family protein [candidate division WWE3 bacterium]|uniref:YibE/F family protein n=1 Tax=candidate division WWE3 bacterium TaxID=2053526 RepID=A0A7X9E6I2_UNCKA|nr:YibE/F family protein [candidate division WWE3 bacterium]
MKTRNLLKPLSILILAFLFIFPYKVSAQEMDASPVQKTYEGVIKSVLEENKNTSGGYYQKLEVEIADKDQKGKILNVENGSGDTPVSQKYKKGDALVLTGFQDENGELHLYVSDYIRRGQLLSLFLIFLILSVVIAGKRGATSFVGMLITFFIIFSFVLPKISTGSSPILIILLFSVIAIPITFYLSHGLNTKTTVAIVGTVISLAITVVLSAIYVGSAKLTGYTTDEASFLQIMKGGTINMRGILLAGIIIGFLGVLDDITISQSAIVFQLKNANRRLNFSDLFKRSMDVGKDHIASMINTLILVYTGASLPLLLLFTDTSRTFNEVVNYEIISSEIIRTLLGSIGLILAVPITTALAAFVADTTEGGDQR